jgi:phosphate transport system substrate-binding protein
VQNTKGAIGYVEYAYAWQSRLTTVNMINKDGKAVEPSAAAFQAAAENAKWDKEEGFYEILTDEPGAATWPITGASFILVHRQPKDPAAVGEALKLAEDLDYVPLPKNLITEIEKVWASEIRDASGKPLYSLAH